MHEPGWRAETSESIRPEADRRKPRPRMASDAFLPIGLFDSGLGGLSVLREIRRGLPQEQEIFLADAARQPYGPRSREEVRAFSLEIADFFCRQGVKMVIIACNTASIAGEEAIRSRFPDLPVVGMIGPAVRAALAVQSPRRIGVFGTTLTVASKAYEDRIRAGRPDAEVMGVACPELIRIAQSGALPQDGRELEELIRACFRPLSEFGAELLILGCTDLGNLRREIEMAVGDLAQVVDPAAEVALEVRRVLLERGMLRPPGKGSGHCRLLATGPHRRFTAASARRITGDSSLAVEYVDLEAALAIGHGKRDT